jgi:hypothetical protein
VSDAGRFVAVAGRGNTPLDSNVVAYSDDGKIWSTTSLPSTQNWVSVVYNSVTTIFLAMAYNGTSSSYSNDGIVWYVYPHTTDYITTPSWSSITCSKSGNFVIGSQASEVSYSGDNGVNWAQFPAVSCLYITCSPVSNTYVSILFPGNDAPSKNPAYSIDGKNWQITTSLTNIVPWTAVTCSPLSGTFVAIAGGGYSGNQSSDAAAYSTDDGRTWISTTLQSVQSWTGVTCSPINGKFVAVSTNKVNYSVDDGRTWTEITPSATWYSPIITCSPVTGRFFAAGYPDKMYYSADAITWIRSTTPSELLSNTKITSMTCSITGRFVMALNTRLPYGTFISSIYYSDDAITWTQTPSTIPGTQPYYVTCSPKTGRFVATSISNSLYSDDGITWYPITTKATIAYSQPFAGYSAGTNFTFTPTIDSVTVDNTSFMKIGDSVQGYPASTVTAISGNTVTFQVATPQPFSFIYVGSTFATYNSSNVSFQTYSSSTSSTSFAMIPMDVPSGYVKIFKENTDYGVSVIYPSRIDKLSRVTVRWLDNYGKPISFNTFDNNSFTLRIHSTRMVPEVDRPLTLPDPVELPKPQKMVAWISIAVLILGLLIITFMKNR